MIKFDLSQILPEWHPDLDIHMDLEKKLNWQTIHLGGVCFPSLKFTGLDWTKG